MNDVHMGEGGQAGGGSLNTVSDKSQIGNFNY